MCVSGGLCLWLHTTHTHRVQQNVTFYLPAEKAHFSWEYTELPCIECPGMWSPEDDCSKEFHGLSEKFMRASGAVIYLAHRHFNTPHPHPQLPGIALKYSLASTDLSFQDKHCND